MHVKVPRRECVNPALLLVVEAVMRSILVLAGGSASDGEVFNTALAVAKPLRAHLEFLHVRPAAGEAALSSPHVDFARGAALSKSLQTLESGAKERSLAAFHHFEALCEKECIDIALDPCDRRTGPVAASWCEERHDVPEKIMQFARHNDLVIIGRRAKSNGLPYDLTENLVMNSGRPVLIAPDKAIRSAMDTVLVCWKETPEAARAVAATVPFLAACRRVVLGAVGEGEQRTPEGICHLARRLAWDGVPVETRWLRSDGVPVERRLEALADEIDAGSIVMGAYGHGPVREMVFGGCSRYFLNQSNRPLLMMH